MSILLACATIATIFAILWLAKSAMESEKPKLILALASLVTAIAGLVTAMMAHL
jgi:hypothetical protein